MWSNPKPLEQSVLEEALAAGSVYWIFDLDGTLVDLASRPDAVVVPDSLQDDLEILHARSQGSLAIVSGRSLSDLESRIRSRDITLVGNHGAEWRLNRAYTTADLSPEIFSQLDNIRARLTQLSEHTPKSQLEDKRWTLSFHYRNVASERWGFIESSVQSLVAHYPALELRPADACWEIRPRSGPTKGDAVRQLLVSEALPLVFGDDWTDEDAFEAAGPGAITAVVGPRRPTGAAYELASPTVLRSVLHRIAQH